MLLDGSSCSITTIQLLNYNEMEDKNVVIIKTMREGSKKVKRKNAQRVMAHAPLTSIMLDLPRQVGWGTGVRGAALLENEHPDIPFGSY